MDLTGRCELLWYSKYFKHQCYLKMIARLSVRLGRSVVIISSKAGTFTSMQYSFAPKMFLNVPTINKIVQKYLPKDSFRLKDFGHSEKQTKGLYK